MPIIVTPAPVFNLQWGNADKSFSYMEDKKIIIRDTEQYSIIKTLNSPTEKFVSGTFILPPSGKDKVIGYTDDGSIYFWQNPYNEMSVVSGYNYTGKMYGVAFSRNGNNIAFGDRFGDIHLLRQHQVLKNEFSESVIKGVNSPVYTLSFSEDGKFLVTGNQSGMAYVWNVNTQKMVTGFNFYSRKNQKIVFDGDKVIYPLDKDTIGIRDILNESGGAVNAKNLTVIKVSANIVDYDLDIKGNFLAVVNENNGMDYIDVKNKIYLGSLPPLESGNITSIKLNRTGKVALIGDHKGEIFIIKMDDFIEVDSKAAPTIQSGTMNPASSKSKDDAKADSGKDDKKSQKEDETADKNAIDADKYYKYRKGHSLDFRANFLMQEQPYFAGYSLEVGYLFAEIPKVPSMYAGARSGFQFAWPSGEYPYTYTSGTATLQNPYLIGITTCFPVGIYILPFKNTDFYFREEVDIGFSYETLWNGSSGSNTIITPGGVSFEFGDTFTFGYKDYLANLSVKYNTGLGLAVSIGLGYNWKLTKRVMPGKVPSLKENKVSSEKNSAQDSSSKDSKENIIQVPASTTSTKK
ncbi:MAG: hypothetical protein K6F15_07360 [Treponema sp.]|nr:hypothetical protein [Treponema sp.]